MLEAVKIIEDDVKKRVRLKEFLDMEFLYLTGQRPRFGQRMEETEQAVRKGILALVQPGTDSPDTIQPNDLSAENILRVQYRLLNGKFAAPTLPLPALWLEVIASFLKLFGEKPEPKAFPFLPEPAPPGGPVRRRRRRARPTEQPSGKLVIGPEHYRKTLAAPAVAPSRASKHCSAAEAFLAFRKTNPDGKFDWKPWVESYGPYRDAPNPKERALKRASFIAQVRKLVRKMKNSQPK